MEIKPPLPADEATREDESVQPIVIRKLDRLETTEPSSMNGG
ncbi:MAG TPA: hypothetical protein VH520_10420 [Streptosporangiaceae bacterium]|jgi:hypothetical protein